MKPAVTKSTFDYFDDMGMHHIMLKLRIEMNWMNHVVSVRVNKAALPSWHVLGFDSCVPPRRLLKSEWTTTMVIASMKPQKPQDET